MNEHEQLRQTLERILAQDTYQAYYQDQRNIFQRIRDWLFEWGGKLLERWFGGLSPSQSVGDAIIVLLLIIVGIFLIVLIGLLSTNMLRRYQLKRKHGLALNKLDPASEEDYWKQFDQAIHEQDLQKAVRIRFILALFVLDKNDLLNVQSWKTNWDYFNELSGHHKTIATQFYQVAVYFESVTYGNKPVHSAPFDQFLKQVEQLEQEEDN
ncbi:hypothetical protein SAMN04488134_11045 [Amphibacillus marinus]|uniref:DUF4129 domain-containing protein n=1 Tax=Amphibacillus marinus TaxID=872970 RepID=A0A1H8RDC8_9BACI|nr:hypothetical protein [Amphibacillus marinus]SEO64267.1 hypothetical protein SAMN04488134_11045 [Amphibacillus marinus]